MNTDLERLPPITDIAQLVTEVTGALLGAVSEPRPASSMHPRDNLWTGCVMIDGPLRGAIVVAGPRQFAIRVASKMFETAPADVSDSAARDAFAEFTNIVGGNIKALISTQLGETCRLHLPIVANGTMTISGTVSKREVCVACDGDVLSIDVLELG